MSNMENCYQVQQCRNKFRWVKAPLCYVWIYKILSSCHIRIARVNWIMSAFIHKYWLMCSANESTLPCMRPTVHTLV
jgi:hypothetical protein